MGNDTPIEIACDESGNDGENSLNGSSTVFAHASVALSWDSAEHLMAEVRNQTGSQSAELKSRVLLNYRNTEVARWLLQQPTIINSSSVHLTHKRFFLVTKLFDSTVEELAHSQGIDMYEANGARAGATLLFYLAPNAYGDDWNVTLEQFQRLLRSKTRSEAQERISVLSARVWALLARRDEPLANIVGTLFAGIEHLASLTDLQLGNGLPEKLRTGDPLLAALGATVRTWAERSGRPVLIIHDEAKELTPARAAQFRHYLARPELVAPSRLGTGVQLHDLRLVNSQDDPRIQVADLLAGIGRAVGETVANDTPHPLLEAFTPLISELSIWPHPDNMAVSSSN